MAKGRFFQTELSDDDIDELMILADKEITSLTELIELFDGDTTFDFSNMKRRLQRIKNVRKTLGEIR